MLGARIKKLRKGKFSQAELAERLGVHEMTVRRWENTDRQPTADALQKLAQALNTTTGYLLGETDDPAKPGTERTAVSELSETNVRFTDVTWVPVVDGAITVGCGTGRAYAEDVEWNVGLV